MKKPNLFIVGFPKCGSSAIYNLLKQHPDIFMSEYKEPNYFIREMRHKDILLNKKIFYSKNIKNYLNLFNGAKKEKYIGDASVKYVFSKTAFNDIYNFNNNSKIIIIIREPIEFLRSLHQQLELNISYNNIDLINYSQYIKPYINKFGKNNIKIIIYEDFKNNNIKTYKDIINFLKLPYFKPEIKIINQSKFYRLKFIRSFFDRNNVIYIYKKIEIITPKPLWLLFKKIYNFITIKNTGKINIDNNFKKNLKKNIKKEVLKVNKLLRKEKLIDKDLTKLWGY